MESICRVLYDRICGSRLQDGYKTILKKVYGVETDPEGLVMTPDKLHEVLTWVILTWPSYTTAVLSREILPFVMQAREDERAARTRSLLQELTDQVAKLHVVGASAPAVSADAHASTDEPSVPETPVAQAPAAEPAAVAPVIDVHEWLHANSRTVNQWAEDNTRAGLLLDIQCEYFAAHGMTKYLAHMLKHRGVTRRCDITDYAAAGGHLATLELMLANGFPLSANCCMKAAMHLHVLKWLYANGSPITTEMLVDAAQNNRLEILKWMVETGAQVHPEVYAAAVAHFRPDIVDYLHSEGCAAYTDDVFTAIRRGYVAV